MALDYERLFVNSVKNLIADILEEVASFGPEFMEENEPTITLDFSKGDCGLPSFVREKFPDKRLNLIIQHNFKDLRVDRVQKIIYVTLSFSGKQFPLTIPFAQVLAYTDPTQSLVIAIPHDETAGSQPIETEGDTEAQSTVEGGKPELRVVETENNIVSVDFGAKKK